MKITRIETFPVCVPVNPTRAIRAAGAHHTQSPFLFVRVRTDADVNGLGEVSCTPDWSGEDNRSADAAIRDRIAPVLLGQDPTHVEQLSRVIDGAIAGNSFTKAGVEMALWDILGKAAGLPLYRLLGGPVRESVPTKFAVSGAAPAEAARIAECAVEEGFRAMKVKVGLDPIEDVERVCAVREAIGPDVRVGVDANGGWSKDAAIRALLAMLKHNIYFAEQPVKPGVSAIMAQVRRNVGVPIVADESVYTPVDALNLIGARAADVFSVYVGKGGIGPARRIAAIAEAAGVACTVGSNLELGVAAAAMIHLAMATPGIRAEEYPCDILTPFYYDSDLLIEPLDITADSARPPEKPGLGVELDEKALWRYRVD